MELHQFRTDGEKPITELRTRDMEGAKATALALVAHPEASGVYRIQFVDAEYARVAWDTDALVFAGAS